MCLRFCSLLLNYIDILLVLTRAICIFLFCIPFCARAQICKKIVKTYHAQKKMIVIYHYKMQLQLKNFLFFLSLCHTSCYLSITIQRANNNHSFGKTYGKCLRNVSQLIDRSFDSLKFRHASSSIRIHSCTHHFHIFPSLIPLPTFFSLNFRFSIDFLHKFP